VLRNELQRDELAEPWARLFDEATLIKCTAHG